MADRREIDDDISSNQATSSLSKGAFAFPAKRSKHGKKKPVLSDYVDSECNFANEQIAHFQHVWSSIQKVTEEVQSEVAGELFAGLVEYIQDCSKRKFYDEVSAAALVTGINTPDHDVLYEQIKAHLHKHVTPHVVLLQYNSSSNPMKSIMHSIYTQLTSSDSGANRSSITYSDLEKWYVQQKVQGVSPRKRKKVRSVTHHSSPVVIIFEDFCSFPMQCMQDFIISCRNHLSSMPCVLIFGVALSLSSLRRTLTHEISSILSIEAFQMTHSSVYLSVLIEKLLIKSDLPFRLGNKPFQLLLDNFLCHDFSIQKFIHGMKFCLMEHCVGGAADVTSVTSGAQLPAGQLDYIRTLQSFRSYVESCDYAEQIKLLENDKYTMKIIKSLLNEIQLYHARVPHILQCIHCLCKDLPSPALGKREREIYQCTLSDDFTKKLSEIFKLLNHLSRPDLTQKIEKWIEILREKDEVTVRKLEELLAQLNGIEETLKKEECEKLSTTKALKSPPQKMSLYTLRKSLQQQKPRHVTLYESIRNDVLKFMHRFIEHNMASYKTLPLYELWYFDEVHKLKAAVNAMPRAALHTALTRPHVYLEELEAVGPTDQSISRLEPDVAIAYKLHLECGTMINMRDWLEAFISVHNTVDNVVSEPELRTRFMHAAAELQHMGFIKPTKRKTDHVMRLTWGGL